MKNCFITSLYVPSEESILILKNLILKLNEEFNEPLFVIGFNQSDYVNTFIGELNQENKINFIYDIVSDNLKCDSDASGYQCALKLLKDSNIRYDLYWFIHSKAITTGRDNERDYMVNDFISNKKNIENLFNENDFVGSYGDMIIQLGTLKTGHKFSVPTSSGNYLDKYYDFIIKLPLEYFYAKTFFVVKGDIINNFIDNCDYGFFTNPLNIDGSGKTDRYFFERDFIRIVDKMGYLLLGRVVSNHISDNRWGYISTEESNNRYIKEVSLWLDLNNINIEKEKVLNTLLEWQRQ